MQKTIYVIALLILTASLYAHPASSVTLKYDQNTDLLTVSYDHNVKSPAEHYIKTVSIKVGGVNVITQNLSMQDSAMGGSLVYKLAGLKPGAKIEATTECSKGGKKSGTLTLGK